MPHLDVQSGPARVIASGIATTFAGNGLRLAWSEGEVRAEVELVFASDPAVAGVAVHAEPFDGGYRLRCVNFDAVDGRGSAVPVFLGGSGSTGIFFHFRVSHHGRSPDRTVTYTFYAVPDAVVPDAGGPG